MRNVVTTSAVILRATNFGEADKVVSFLGRTTGKVNALARGARKSNRRFAGGLGLGAVGEADIREREGADLALLEGFETSAANIELGSDLGRTAHAAYALELCDRLCPSRHPEPEVFDLVVDFLARLLARGARVERIRGFELGLLRALGLGPLLKECAGCGRSDFGAEVVRWLPQEGGIVCGACATKGTALFPAVRCALAKLDGADLESTESLVLSREENAGCREALLELLRGHIPGPMRSLDFIEKLRG